MPICVRARNKATAGRRPGPVSHGIRRVWVRERWKMPSEQGSLTTQNQEHRTYRKCVLELNLLKRRGCQTPGVRRSRGGTSCLGQM